MSTCQHYISDRSVYAKVPGQEVHVDDGEGGGYKVRFRGFEE